MRLVIIGYGVMGSAILKRAIAARVVRRSQCMIATRRMDPVAACRKADVVLIAVKPQDAPPLLRTLRGTLRPTTLVISVMAGITLAVLARTLRHHNIVRAMPNTPAQIGQGMTVWTSTRSVTARDRAFAQKLFCAFGKELFVRDERLLDAATAVSGSGPAYVFAFAEALIVGARRLGFSKDAATLLVRETLAGSTALWSESGLDVATLRKQVTSKKGTTAAALAVFTRRQFVRIIDEALRAAYRRSKILRATLDRNVKIS